MTEYNGLERSSSTEELRRLLDERDVEYEAEGGWFTRWPGCGTVSWEASECSGYLEVTGAYLTPEQAIEATLGAGECRVEFMHGYTDPYVSTRYTVELSCHTLEDWPDSEPPAYCPWCGRRVG